MTIKIFRERCKECNQLIEATSQSQLVWNMNIHRYAMHKKELKENEVKDEKQ